MQIKQMDTVIALVILMLVTALDISLTDLKSQASRDDIT
jgi:hypothetical protein